LLNLKLEERLLAMSAVFHIRQANPEDVV
jgi:hypothetical protein